MKDLRPMILEYKEHLQALKDGEPFEPFLTAPKDEGKSSPKKRKRGGGGRKAKRQRGDDNDDDGMELDDEDDFIDDGNEDEDADADTDAEDAMVEDALNLDDVIDIDSDSDDVVVLSDSDDSDATKSKKKGKPKKNAEPVTQASLKEIIARKEVELKALRARLAEQKETRRDAVAKLNEHKKASSKLQKEKNAFCSIKRNEVCGLVAESDLSANSFRS